MRPMSKKKRLSYLFGLTVVFFLLLPVIILYAIGYRLGDVSWLDLESTGGIFVRTERSGVEVYVDGVIDNKTGIFQHNFLISDLEPGVHELLVRADGYNQWVKKVEVFAEKVTEINPYLVHNETILEMLSQYVLPDGSVVTATSTVELKKITNKMVNPEYFAASKLFASSSPTSIATSSRVLFASVNFNSVGKKGLVLKNKVALWQEGNDLFVEWLGDKDGAPYYFCSADEVCEIKKKIPIGNKFSHFDFYPGKNNYVLVVLSDGIYVHETDDRTSAQNKAVLIPGKNLDFRINTDGTLYVKGPGAIYVADL